MNRRVTVTPEQEAALIAAAHDAQRAAYGDSNDAEISAWQDAMYEAFDVLGIKIPDIDFDEDDE